MWVWFSDPVGPGSESLSAFERFELAPSSAGGGESLTEFERSQWASFSELTGAGSESFIAFERFPLVLALFHSAIWQTPQYGGNAISVRPQTMQMLLFGRSHSATAYGLVTSLSDRGRLPVPPTVSQCVALSLLGPPYGRFLALLLRGRRAAPVGVSRGAVESLSRNAIESSGLNE